MARAQATEVYEPSEVATLLREYADRLEKTPKAPSVAKAQLRKALEAVAEAITVPDVVGETDDALRAESLERTRVHRAIEVLGSLSASERRAVLAGIATEEDGDAELSPAWSEEIDRRVEAVRNGTSESFTREQVRQRLSASIAAVRGNGSRR
jgi:hypothetical protein